MGEPSVVKWNPESILAHLKDVAREQLNMSSEQIAGINPDARILDSLQLDSLATVVLMAAIEKDFGCAFDPEELQQVETVRDLVALIAKRTSREAQA